MFAVLQVLIIFTLPKTALKPHYAAAAAYKASQVDDRSSVFASFHPRPSADTAETGVGSVGRAGGPVPDTTTRVTRLERGEARKFRANLT